MNSVEFLKKWLPDGPWGLVAISPKEGKAISGEFITNSERISSWLAENNGTNNCYFHSNTLAGPVSPRGRREDFLEVPWLHVDVDPRVGEDVAAEQARILAAIREYGPPPTVVVHSGGGYQAYWKLEEPIRIERDLARAEEAKLYNKYIELALEGDHCHSIDHIMRIPGTINLPDKKKLDRGRVACVASLVEWHDDRVYPLSMFPKAHLVQKSSELGFDPSRLDLGGDVRRLGSVDELGSGVSDETKTLIMQGVDPSRFGSRSEALFAVCCSLVRAGIDDKVIYAVITDPAYGISASVLEQRSGSDRYAIRQIQRAKEFAGPDGCPELAELNDKHAVICDMGGRVKVVTEQATEINRTRISSMSFTDFKHRYCNRKVSLGKDDDGKEKFAALGTWWLHHPMRRQYETIVFAPGREIAGAYNLWRGFACEPKKGDGHQRYLDHVHDVICNRDDTVYNYVVGWMARTVQTPATTGMVAIVMRGRQGTGKGVFAKGFGSLFGRHFIHVSNAKHLAGNFNAHLRDAVVVFADEAFYAGDKQNESTLKALITEELKIVEGKGIDSEQAPNYTHLIMASNYDWVVPANESERRFMVVDVSDREMQKDDYFRTLTDSFYSKGGKENLLHYLMAYDLSGFQVTKMPKTPALQAQKLESMPSERKWLHSKLQDGMWISDHDEWRTEVMRDMLYANYIEFARITGDRHPRNPHAFAMFLSPFLSDKRRQRRAAGGQRGTTYTFYDLGIMRQLFDDLFGGPYEW